MTSTDYAIASRPKMALISLMAVAFLCGAAAGAVGMKSYAFRSAHHYIALQESKEITLQRWRKKLNLSDDQSAQIRLILEDFNKYYDNVVAEGHERIMQVLTPDQKRRFEKMLRERF
jgi:Spy/CpxP family protein refolding chaperone